MSQTALLLEALAELQGVPACESLPKLPFLVRRSQRKKNILITTVVRVDYLMSQAVYEVSFAS